MTDFMSWSDDEKYDYLDNQIDPENMTDDDLDKLEYFAKDGDATIRMMVAGLLISAPHKRAEPILIPLIDDKSGIVRVCACESLGISRSQVVLEKLLAKAHADRYYLVRGYAVVAAAEVAININQQDFARNYLKNRLKKEKNKRVQIDYYYAFCLLGEEDYYKNILANLNDRPWIRMPVVNNLRDIINPNNRDEICQALYRRLKVEKFEGVIDVIERTLQAEELRNADLRNYVPTRLVETLDPLAYEEDGTIFTNGQLHCASCGGKEFSVQTVGIVRKHAVCPMHKHTKSRRSLVEKKIGERYGLSITAKCLECQEAVVVFDSCIDGYRVIAEGGSNIPLDSSESNMYCCPECKETKFQLRLKYEYLPKEDLDEQIRSRYQDAFQRIQVTPICRTCYYKSHDFIDFKTK